MPCRWARGARGWAGLGAALYLRGLLHELCSFGMKRSWGAESCPQSNPTLFFPEEMCGIGVPPPFGIWGMVFPRGTDEAGRVEPPSLGSAKMKQGKENQGETWHRPLLQLGCKEAAHGEAARSHLQHCVLGSRGSGQGEMEPGMGCVL